MKELMAVGILVKTLRRPNYKMLFR